MSSETASPKPGMPRRFTVLISAGLLAAALVGFLRGVTDEPIPIRPPASREHQEPDRPTHHIPAALNYSEISSHSLGPNAKWENSLSKLRSKAPGLFDQVVRTDALKEKALADRSARRAFDGAPPTIPHAIAQQDAANCLTCHAAGARVGEQLAVPISHPPYDNCTQCHVASAPAELATKEQAANSFVGLYRAGKGERAWPNAPPTIPHSTWMRSECLSCHGLIARDGIRTTHPWQTSCTQCHAPSAQLDQAPLAASPTR